MDAVLQAFSMVMDPTVLIAIALSGLFGMFVGAVPGLTATMATALLVPITFFLPPVAAVATMVTATYRALCCASPVHRLLPPIVMNPTPTPARDKPKQRWALDWYSRRWGVCLARLR